MNRIQAFREGGGIRQVELASQLGWSQSRLSNYETGHRVPGLDEARAVVRGLNELGVNCSLDEVFPAGGEEAA